MQSSFLLIYYLYGHSVINKNLFHNYEQQKNIEESILTIFFLINKNKQKKLI